LSKKAATEDELGDLHRQVAIALKTMLTPVQIEGELGTTHDKGAVALAIAFLKNNGITASVTQNDALAELKQALVNRGRNPQRVRAIELQDAADKLTRDLEVGNYSSLQ